jgi:hypothetical protein
MFYSSTYFLSIFCCVLSYQTLLMTLNDLLMMTHTCARCSFTRLHLYNLSSCLFFSFCETKMCAVISRYAYIRFNHKSYKYFKLHGSTSILTLTKLFLEVAQGTKLVSPFLMNSSRALSTGTSPPTISIASPAASGRSTSTLSASATSSRLTSRRLVCTNGI